jgi:translation elongation factor EF-1alpha
MIRSRREGCRCITDQLKSEVVGGFSERSSYIAIETAGTRCQLISIPGRRKYWKWSDCALCDSDIAVIVVKSSKTDLRVSELLEPLFVSFAQGVERFLVVINLFGKETESDIDFTKDCVKRDLQRVFGARTGTIPILAIDPYKEASICSFLEVIEQQQKIPREIGGPFQMSINSIFQKDDSVILQGKVRSGRVRLNDQLYLEPPGLQVYVESIRQMSGLDVEDAEAGQLVALKIPGLSKSHVSTGMMLVGDRSIGKGTRLIKVEVEMVNNKHPIRSGFSPVVSILSCQSHGKIVDISSGSKEELFLGDRAILTLSLQKTVFIRTSCYDRVVLRQENVVIAIGLVRGILD